MGGPLRLLHVSQPIEGGVPEVVMSLVTDQVERGYEVHVACPPGVGLAQRLRTFGSAHQHPWPATRSPGPFVGSEVIRLRRIIRSVDPHLVVLHSAKAGLTGRLALRGQRPTAFVPHAWSFLAVRGVVARASMAWEIFASRWTHLTICVSDDERDRGRVIGISCPMEVVPNGVDVETRVPRPAGPARTKLDLPERPTVVCVGRLSEQKGQDLLVASWRRVQAEVPDAHLVLVGDGPLLTELRAKSPPGVTFFGAREDVDDFLAAADVVAVPSRWEAGPLVPLEAMAMGRPVVAFAVDGMRASVGNAGLIVEPGDLLGLTHALIDLLRSPNRAKAAGSVARERALALANRKHSLRTWDRVLTSLLD